MKKILGLDLGTNSIGWALVEIDHENGIVRIIGIGARILPMDAGEIGDFEAKGKIKSSAAERTAKRGPRRINERYSLRRDRLHLVLNLLDALPEHYKIEIDFMRNGQKCGQFKPNKEPKLAYKPNGDISNKFEFIFQDSYNEMIRDIDAPQIRNVKHSRIPFDWTLYFLRQKAMKDKISLEELAWILLSYNQKRGYEKLEVEDQSAKDGEFVEELDLRVKEVVPKKDDIGNPYFEVCLEGIDNFTYREYSEQQLTFKGDLKELRKVSKVDDKGNIDAAKTEYTILDIYELKIRNVEYRNEDGKHEYTLTFENGWQEIKSPKSYTFRYNGIEGKQFDYIVETSYNPDGTTKQIQKKDRKLREPDFGDDSKDWTLLKKRTEKEALKFNAEHGFVNKDRSIKNFISPKIYSVLKNDARSGNRTKIIGGMFQTVERKFYREEINEIIEIQKQFHNNLNDKEVFERCVRTLYPSNDAHANKLLKSKSAIQNLLVEDILLFQRPLKSKKSDISDCKYEIRYWKDNLDKDGNQIELVDETTGEIFRSKQPVYHKAVSASHPYFQEFRIWDKLHSIRLIQIERKIDGKLQTNVDVTKEYFDKYTYQALFNKLNMILRKDTST